MAQKLVSIVIATYNGAKFLQQQLDSILQQTYSTLELIIVDDGSIDDTLKILYKYAALDDRIHIYPAEKNLGLVANFERGLKLASGDFIALSDQDDLFHKDKIELLVRKLEENPNKNLVVSDLSLIDANGVQFSNSMWKYQDLKPRCGKPFSRLIYSNFATGCAMMFRRRLLSIALPFPPNVLVHDWWLAIVAASKEGGGICLVPLPLTAYRQHGANVIGAKIGLRITPIKILRFLARPSRGSVLIEKRIKDWMPNINRTKGYLQRNIWTISESKIINEVAEIFEGYLIDGQSSISERLLRLPKRLRYAATTRNFKICIAIVFVTLWPHK